MRIPLRIGAGIGVAVLFVTVTACDSGEPPTSLHPGDISAGQLVMDEMTLDLAGLTDQEALGKAIYFDINLSLRKNQSCASCHAPEYGFTGPIPGVNLGSSVYNGSVRNLSGDRKPPSASYATLSPVLHYNAIDEVWVGGNFWDGRATGETLGNPAAEQALGPFLNPVEQALPDMICVVYRVATGDYADLWEEVMPQFAFNFPPRLDKDCRKDGPIAYEDPEGDIAAAYDAIGLAVAAFEGSSHVNAFSSKFDQVGYAGLTEQERRGHDLFFDENIGEGGAGCSLCHPAPEFTDFTYDNLGVPSNPFNPSYMADPGFQDLGLGAFLERVELDEAYEDFYGAMKVPTLRNVGLGPGNAPKAFAHNGYFKSLRQIVHFYNTRDLLPECTPAQLQSVMDKGDLAMVGFDPACWPAPEVAQNVNVDELGNLGLSDQDEEDLVAFMMTLSDGWMGN